MNERELIACCASYNGKSHETIRTVDIDRTGEIETVNQKACVAGRAASPWISSVSRMTFLRILQRIQQCLQRVKVGGLGEMEVEPRGLRALAILGLAPTC